MDIALIAAVAKNGVIGKGLSLPWHYPEDLKFFRETTLGQAIIMGRKTFESIGKPLPKRYNIVLTSDPSFIAPEGVDLARTPEEALDLARRYYFDQIDQVKDLEHFDHLEQGDQTCFVIGGAAVYAAFLPLASILYLTRIYAEHEGDVYFPPVNWSFWKRVEEKPYPDFVIQRWERI